MNICSCLRWTYHEHLRGGKWRNVAWILFYLEEFSPPLRLGSLKKGTGFLLTHFFMTLSLFIKVTQQLQRKLPLRASILFQPMRRRVQFHLFYQCFQIVKAAISRTKPRGPLLRGDAFCPYTLAYSWLPNFLFHCHLAGHVPVTPQEHLPESATSQREPRAGPRWNCSNPTSTGELRPRSGCPTAWPPGRASERSLQ